MRRAIVAVITALTLGSCGAKHSDSVDDNGKFNREPVEVVVFPEFTGNVYTKCDHGNRIYMYGGGTPMIAVVPHGC